MRLREESSVMEERPNTSKLPIPRLPSDKPTTTARKRKVVKSPGTKLAEKRLRDRNRVYLGSAFQRWRDIRVLKGFRTDADLALFLMNSYQSQSEASTSTPLTGKRRRIPMPALSCVEESLSEREEDYSEFEIQLAQGETATEEHGEEHGIDWTDDTWTPTKNTEEVSTSEEDETIEVDSYSDDSDEDYMPTIRIRSGASLAANINVEKLPEISLEDVVHGVVHEPAVQENDDTSIPEGIKVEDPEDIVNQKAAIVYHICLKQLTTFLELPITICTEKVAKKECGAAGPFEVDLIKRGTALIVKWDAYCVETIEDFWEESRASVISGLQQDEVVALGEHEWSLDACRHDPLVDEPNKDWIKKGSKAHKALSEIILSERFLKNVEKDYAYIPSLQSKIVAARINSKAGLPKRTKLRHNDPRHLGLVCGVPAPSTKELRDKHMSRGDGSMAKLSIVFPWFRIITQCTEVIPQDPGKTQDSCM
ncbi:hypothetical protein WMY93_011129 [Mugilogobius chulae]|uniref:Uncharacterized protein n=1 Tax=Mugilogobius chulae TaxID=88201 RepID=A0AAW0PDV3_9GOBI